jgi:hypothetical protein
VSYIEEIDAIMRTAKPLKQEASDKDYIKEIDEIMSNNLPELTGLDKAAQIVRGLPSAAGSLIDLAALPGNMLAEKLTGERVDKQPHSEMFTKGFDKLYGKDLTPTDTAGKVRQGIGEFITPLPGAAALKTAKMGIGAVAKALPKAAAGATGASLAINATPRLSQEGTPAGMVEDVLKAGLGSGLGKGALTAGKGVANAVLHPKETATKGAAKIASKFIDPDKEILKKAEKYNVELPLNVGAKSNVLDKISNNYLKSILTAKQYKEFMENADRSLFEAVKRELGDITGEGIKPHAASSRFRDYALNKEKSLKKEANKLYDEATLALKDKDVVVPENTLDFLNSNAVRNLLSTKSPSSGQKRVISRINEISKILQSEGEIPKDVLKRYKDNPKFLEIIKKSFSKRKKEVSVNDLVNLRKALLDTLDHDPRVVGVESYLSGMVKNINKDIKRTPNKDFLQKQETANKFFAQNVGKRFREGAGPDILKRNPQEAYNLMGSVKGVKKLKKIVGGDTEAFEDLRKAKIREIMEKSIEGDLSKDGTIMTGSFSKLFKKGEKRQDLLEELLGKKSYNNLEEIADIAAEFSKSGRNLLNTSGTAHALLDAADFKEGKENIGKILGYLFGGYGASKLVSAAGVPLPVSATVAATLNPYTISLLLSNKNFITQARVYALARKRGQEKYANTILKRLVTMTDKAIKSNEKAGLKAAVLANSKRPKED